METWKTVKGFGNHYEASNLGRVKSKDRVINKKNPLQNRHLKHLYKGKILKQSTNKEGYKFIKIGVDKKKYSLQVGSVVLRAFKGLPQEDQMCCHNDGNPANNNIENLRWGNAKENAADKKLHGTNLEGCKHPMSKLKEEEVLDIFNSKESGSYLSKKYNTSYSNISRIRKGNIWKNILNEKEVNNTRFKRLSDKLDYKKATEIRNMYQKGYNRKKLSKAFNVSYMTICDIINNRTWKYE